MIRLHLLVEGRVQGVGYRFFTKETAEKYNCTGWVKNLPNGHVEAEIQGEENNVQLAISSMRKGPRMGFVNDFTSYAIPVEITDKSFKITY